MKKQYLYRALPMALLGLTLQSCIVAKKYDRPEVTKEEAYRGSNTNDTLSMATMPWKDLFTDQVLIQHIETGLANNLDMQIAIENILAAQAYMQQSKWGYAPTINLNANYSHSVLSKNGAQGIAFGNTRVKNDQYELSGQAAWELDIWGKIRSNKRAFTASYLQTVAVQQAIKTQLISTISTTYYQLLALDKQRDITERTINNREKSLETILALKEAGQVTEVAVKQTQAQLLNAQALLVDLENNIKQTENTFSILLAQSPGEIERTSLDQQKVDVNLAVGVPIQLLSNRPDVKAAEYGLINAFEMTNVARANFYPALRLTGNGGLQSMNFDQLFNTNSLFANIIGGLTQPLLNGRQVRTQHQVAQRKRQQAYLNYKKAVLTASKEVSDALYAFESSSKKLGIKRQEYEAYQLATSYSEELLVQGMATYLDVLTAQESALNAELNYINTEITKLSSVVQLYRALGGGTID